MFGWIILGVFLLLIAYVLLRTLMFKPQCEETFEPVPLTVDAEKAARDMAEMLRCKTISHSDPALDDQAEFEKFEKVLMNSYPNVFKTCVYEKLNLRALMLHWKGASADAPIVFMAHFDVVAADESQWERPAFEGLIEDSIIWGRGTLDTKGTLLAAMQAAEMHISEGLVPANDIYFCFGGDEEVMGGGAVSVVDELERRGIRPAMVLDEGGAIVEGVFPGVSAPCALVGIGEKGGRNIEMSVKSAGGHSSAPPAKSPIDTLARACLQIHDHPFLFRISPPAKALFDNLAPHSSFLYRMIFANLWLFSPALDMICKKQGGELNALVRTTTAFTMARGSDGANVLPSSATLTINARILSGDTTESVIERMKNLVHDDSVEFKPLVGSDPMANSPTNTRGYSAIERAIKESFGGVLVSPYLMIACSDSRHYLRICDNVYRFSAMALSKEEREMIHGNNEQVPIKKLAQAVEFYYRLMGILQA